MRGRRAGRRFLNEVLSLMNTFIDDASSGKTNPDHAAQLRSRTASIMESAAQVAEMLAERPNTSDGLARGTHALAAVDGVPS